MSYRRRMKNLSLAMVIAPIFGIIACYLFNLPSYLLYTMFIVMGCGAVIYKVKGRGRG